MNSWNRPHKKGCLWSERDWRANWAFCFTISKPLCYCAAQHHMAGIMIRTRYPKLPVNLFSAILFWGITSINLLKKTCLINVKLWAAQLPWLGLLCLKKTAHLGVEPRRNVRSTFTGKMNHLLIKQHLHCFNGYISFFFS